MRQSERVSAFHTTMERSSSPSAAVPLLRSAMLDEARLNAILTGRGLAMQGVFLCVVDTRGRMTIQENNGNVTQFQALNAGEVKW